MQLAAGIGVSLFWFVPDLGRHLVGFLHQACVSIVFCATALYGHLTVLPVEPAFSDSGHRQWFSRGADLVDLAG